jgi:microcystin-dependent protein
MSDAFLGEIRMFCGSFAPRGWAFCDGQLLGINQNVALFSVIGLAYGGDGKSTFALPNLQGSAPLQAGRGPGLSARDLGKSGGAASVRLTVPQLARHGHALQGLGTPANSNHPTNNVFAQGEWIAGGRSGGIGGYATAAAATLARSAAETAGGGEPHNNLMPYLVVNFIIALQGMFPKRG